MQVLAPTLVAPDRVRRGERKVLADRVHMLRALEAPGRFYRGQPIQDFEPKGIGTVLTLLKITGRAAGVEPVPEATPPTISSAPSPPPAPSPSTMRGFFWARPDHGSRLPGRLTPGYLAARKPP